MKGLNQEPFLIYGTEAPKITMFNLKALKLQSEEAILNFWVAVFLPLIVWAALPLRGMGDEVFLDGVSKGIEMVLLNISGKGTFDPKKGNVIEWFRKALMGVRMEARKAAQVGTKSLEALQEVNPEFDVVDEEDPTHELDEFEMELANWMRLHTEDVIPEPADPDDDAVKYGDPENDRIMFKLPEDNFCPVYYTHETRFKSVDGKWVEAETVTKCVSTMPKKGAASYADEDADPSNAAVWLTFINPETGELDVDYDADERHDPEEESDFASFMESHEGIFSRKSLKGLGEWVGKGHQTRYISAYAPEQKRKSNEMVEPIKEDVEVCVPGDDEAERLMNPYQAPTAQQMAKALELFEIHAAAIKHLAYLQWKAQPEVTVKSVDVQHQGFIKSDGRFMSLKVAAGIAAAIKPANGSLGHMVNVVMQAFPDNDDAALFAERIGAVAALPLQ